MRASRRLIPCPRARPPDPPRRRESCHPLCLSAVLAAGLAASFRYVDQYVRYRGFGPPVSKVAPVARGRIASFSFVSPALGGRRETPLVYLPAGYDRNPLHVYPVLYLLHGTPGDPRTAFVNSLHVGPRMDELVAEHRVRPMIVVMPPGSPGTYDPATEWANGPARGTRWFRYLTHDLVRAVDARYRTIRSRDGRAIAGYSSGPMRRSTRSSGIPGRTASPRPGAATSGRRRARSTGSPRSWRTSRRSRRHRAGAPPCVGPGITSTCTRGAAIRCFR